MKNKTIIFIPLLILLCLITIYFLDFIGYKCIYKELFNIYCAGCGGTRMIKSILKLEFYQAFRYNPLLFIYIILFIIYFIFNCYNYIKFKQIKYPSKKTIIILFIVAILFMILRNISGFEYLRPTKIK